MDIAYVFAGMVVGLVVGLTGVGGGSLMTPLLILFFGISPTTAVGTDLLYAAITKSGGAVVHGFKQTINWRVVGLMASGSVPASLLVVTLLSGDQLAWQSKNQVLVVALGVMLLLTACALIFRESLRRWSHRRQAIAAHGDAHVFADTPAWLASPISTVVLGAVIGVVVSLSSVGAGAVGVTVLLLLYPHMPIARVVGTDIAHAIPLTLVAGLGHAAVGHVDWWLLLTLIVGSLPGVALGSYLATRLPENFVRRALIVLLLLTGGRLVFTA